MYNIMGLDNVLAAFANTNIHASRARISRRGPDNMALSEPTHMNSYSGIHMNPTMARTKQTARRTVDSKKLATHRRNLLQKAMKSFTFTGGIKKHVPNNEDDTNSLAKHVSRGDGTKGAGKSKLSSSISRETHTKTPNKHHRQDVSAYNAAPKNDADTTTEEPKTQQMTDEERSQRLRELLNLSDDSSSDSDFEGFDSGVSTYRT